MARRDRILLYHSGKEKAVAGIATVASTSFSAPGGGEVLIELKVEERLGRPVPLPAVKADPAFAVFPPPALSRAFGHAGHNSAAEGTRCRGAFLTNSAAGAQ